MTQAQVNLKLQDTPPQTENKRSPMFQVLAIRDFRLLWIGEAISLLGDQFHMIALPWLVLQLTGDAFVMGTVLALAAIPRAIFMLIGGAITDRYSPRNVMLLSNMIRMVLVLMLTFIVLMGIVEMWMIYLIALVFGLADAFYFPASQAIVPGIVPQELLQMGNAIVHGTAQMSVFLGPVVAGVLITLLGNTTGADGVPGMTGIGIAFGLDALTFLVSAGTLWMMSTVRLNQEPADPDKPQQSVLSSMRDGFAFILGDSLIRKVFIVSIWINFFLNGPIVIGIPVLADTQYPEGAAAFGIIMSGFGAGALLGIIMAGILPRPRSRYMGTLIMFAVALLGAAEIMLVATSTTAIAFLAVVIAGAGNGYINIILITWFQSSVPPRMIGRMMSVFMFAGVGTAPIGHALTGALLNISPLLTFVMAGSLVMLVAAYMLRDKDINLMGYVMAGETMGEAKVA